MTCGDSTCLLIARMRPSILILIGELHEKNRSEAFMSAMTLNSARTFTAAACSW